MIVFANLFRSCVDTSTNAPDYHVDKFPSLGVSDIAHSNDVV